MTGSPPHGGPPSGLAAVSTALLAMSRRLEVRDVLRTIVVSARELLDAEYAALGVPDDHGGFAQFVVDGISPEQWRRIGPLPRQHGILAAMLHEGGPERLADVREDPRFEGWPAAHPEMSDFLGMPVRDGEETLGALFLANKRGGAPDGRQGFTDEDQELLSLLAQHAAIALTNAHLYERSRELTIAEERSRLAHELHDAVSQKLFSLRLTAQAAAALVDRDPARAKDELQQVAALAAEAADELRAAVTELRPAALDEDGLVATLRTHVHVLDRAHTAHVTFTCEGVRALPATQEEALLRVAQEALHNALRHSAGDRVEVTLTRTQAGERSSRSSTPARASTPGRSAGRAATWAWSPCGTARAASAAGSPCTRSPVGAPRSRWRYPVADSTGRSGGGIRVLLVDDHQVVRRGLRTFLEVQEDIEVVGEASDGEEGIARAEELGPDVILMDIKMPGTDGIEALRRLRELANPARVLIVTSFTEQRTVVPALRAGAAGYVYKDIDPDALAGAIRSVHAGHVLLQPEVALALLSQEDQGSPAGRPGSLTDREREVLGLIADGRSNREIARALVLSEKTVKTHVSNILMKLDLSDRTQAALWAVRHGIAE